MKKKTSKKTKANKVNEDVFLTAKEVAEIGRYFDDSLIKENEELKQKLEDVTKTLNGFVNSKASTAYPVPEKSFVQSKSELFWSSFNSLLELSRTKRIEFFDYCLRNQIVDKEIQELSQIFDTYMEKTNKTLRSRLERSLRSLGIPPYKGSPRPSLNLSEEENKQLDSLLTVTRNPSWLPYSNQPTIVIPHPNMSQGELLAHDMEANKRHIAAKAHLPEKKLQKSAKK